MSHANSLRLTLAIVTASALLPCVIRAQEPSQDDRAMVEAARKAREKQKTEKPAHVIDEEALKPSPGPTNPPDLQTAKASVPTVRGEAAAAPAAESAPAAEQKNADKKDRNEEAKRLTAEVAKAKEKLADLQKQQDLLQRELALDKDTVYSNPDYAHDTAGKAKLDDLQQQINAKQLEVNEAKAHLEDLQSKLAQVAPSDASTPPAPPQP